MKKTISITLALLMILSVFTGIAVGAADPVAGQGMDGLAVSADSAEAYKSETDWIFPAAGGNMYIDLTEGNRKIAMKNGYEYTIKFDAKVNTGTSWVAFKSNAPHWKINSYTLSLDGAAEETVSKTFIDVKPASDGQWHTYVVKIQNVESGNKDLEPYFQFGTASDLTAPALELANLSVTESVIDGGEDGGEETDPPASAGNGMDGYQILASKCTGNFGGDSDWIFEPDNTTNNQKVAIAPKGTSGFEFKKGYEYTLSFKLRTSTDSWVTLKSNLLNVQNMTYAFNGSSKVANKPNHTLIDQPITVSKDPTVWNQHELKFNVGNDKISEIYLYFAKNVSKIEIADLTLTEGKLSAPPVVDSLKIKGTARAGETISAIAEVSDANGDTELAETTYLWSVSENGVDGWASIKKEGSEELETGAQYKVRASDVGKYIRVTATPHSLVEPKDGASADAITEKVLAEGETKIVEFFVSTDGKDTNEGTIDSPFATIEKARDAVRGAGLGDGGATVYIRGGVYPISKTISFSEEDSGMQGTPVVYKAYNGEKVTFMGGKKLDATQAVKVTDSDILDRILDETARTKVMQLDLGAQGITEIPAFIDHGFNAYGIYTERYVPLEIYYNGKALGKARWPNEETSGGYSHISKVYTSTNDNEARSSAYKIGYVDDENHTAKWDFSKMKDLQLGGFVGYDWAQSSSAVAELDVENKTVTSKNPPNYAPRENQRIYFYNLIEEIDVPGESYIDRDSKILYFYPSDSDFANAEMSVSTFASNIINVNGASDITFEGIDFDTSRATMVNIKASDRITISDCDFARGSERAIDLDGNDCVISGCHIFEMAKGGVSVIGGDRIALTGGGNIVENNRIHAVNRIYKSSQPPIRLQGYGHVARYNKLYDTPHTAIHIDASNDITIEHNDISNAVTEAGDMGSIYWGRDPSILGVVIRHNYFHQIGSIYKTQYSQQSVFWDDGATGPEMYGNVFYQGTRTVENGGTDSYFPIKTNGGQYSNIYNMIEKYYDTQWLLCPVCGNKTRIKLREDTTLNNFPLFCPKCKKETLVNAEKFNIKVIAEPDAKTQEPI